MKLDGLAYADRRRLEDIHARHTRATPGDLRAVAHSHPNSACSDRCEHCRITTGYRLEHDAWPQCDDTDPAQADAMRELCTAVPIPEGDARFLANAYLDVKYLLALVESFNQALNSGRS